MNPMPPYDMTARANEIAYEVRRVMQDATLTPKERAGYLRLRAFALQSLADDLEFRAERQ